MLPLHPWCSVSSLVLYLFSFRTPCSWALPIGRSCRRWDRAILQAIQYSLFVRSRELGNLVEDLHCNPHSVSRCPILLKLESLVFNTKSLQLQFQKCAKHLSVAGWIYCYCPTCLVFKEIRADHPQKCYTTPNNTLLRM